MIELDRSIWSVPEVALFVPGNHPKNRHGNAPIMDHRYLHNFFDLYGNSVPEFRTFYPKMGTHIRFKDRYWGEPTVLAQGKDNTARTQFTVPPPPGKILAAKVGSESVAELPFLQKPDYSTAAATALRKKRNTEARNWIENRTREQLDEVRELQKSLLQREKPPAENFTEQFKEQLEALEPISQVDNGVMSARSANLYAHEARQGHRESIRGNSPTPQSSRDLPRHGCQFKKDCHPSKKF